MERLRVRGRHGSSRHDLVRYSGPAALRAERSALPQTIRMSTILPMASPTVPPLPACGERIACRAEAQRRREVRGFDRSAKNPHPTLSLSKGEATEEKTTR